MELSVYNKSSDRRTPLVPIIMCCSKHHEHPAPDDYDASIGSVWRCPTCQEVSARVYSSKLGTHVWVIVDANSAEFNGLGRPPIEEDDE